MNKHVLKIKHVNLDNGIAFSQKDLNIGKEIMDGTALQVIILSEINQMQKIVYSTQKIHMHTSLFTCRLIYM